MAKPWRCSWCRTLSGEEALLLETFATGQVDLAGDRAADANSKGSSAWWFRSAYRGGLLKGRRRYMIHDEAGKISPGERLERERMFLRTTPELIPLTAGVEWWPACPPSVAPGY